MKNVTINVGFIPHPNANYSYQNIKIMLKVQILWHFRNFETKTRLHYKMLKISDTYQVVSRI